MNFFASGLWGAFVLCCYNMLNPRNTVLLCFRIHSLRRWSSECITRRSKLVCINYLVLVSNGGPV
ncbi:hypothetical protein MKX03_034683 [Papaver bracteatum]|nr:hypothetical protein MKX03_034683 [Papaver bracteatum]